MANDHLNRNSALEFGQLCQQVKEKADIVDIVSEYIQLSKRGKDLVGLCPFHDEKSPSFTVSPSKQMYHCFGCGEGGDVLKFVAGVENRSLFNVVIDLAKRYGVPVEEWKANTVYKRTPGGDLKAIAPLPAPIPENWQCVKLLQPATDIPQAVVYPDQKHGEVSETTYSYSSKQWVVRTEWANPDKPKGREKKVLPYHQNAEGKAVCGKGDLPWKAYRIEEAIAAATAQMQDGFPLLLGVEGELCVEAARSAGLAAITLQGGSWQPEQITQVVGEIKAVGAGLVYWRDYDDPGLKKADSIESVCARHQVPCAILDPLEIWDHMPEKGDIADMKELGGEIVERLVEGIRKAIAKQQTIAAVEEFQERSDVAPQTSKLEAAVEQAKLVMDRGLSELEENIQLEKLGKDAGLSSQNWNWNFLRPLRQERRAAHSKNETGSGDRTNSGDSSNPDRVSIAETVETVAAILKEGMFDWVERLELDRLKLKTEMSPSSFWMMVDAQRSALDLVGPGDFELLDRRVAWSKNDSQLCLEYVSPHLGTRIQEDARIQNIDPVAILQYLLPAISSLAGQSINLNVGSHKVPSILWTACVCDSGGGKTRAANLVADPLRRWQIEEKEAYEEEQKLRQGSPKEEGGDEEPLIEKKRIFEVATIQATLKKISAQKGNGSLLLRDELKGYFESLGQFSKNGAGEGLEILLSLWDGSTAIVDRVTDENSYVGAAPRLSLAGGIQPGIYTKLFKDSSDAQGLQARMLPALIKPQRKRRTTGTPSLPPILEDLYRWVDSSFPKIELSLSSNADARFTQIVEEVAALIEKHKSSGGGTGVVTWLYKMDTHVARLAIALHLIECFHEPTKNKVNIDENTLNRAWYLAKYYLNSLLSICDTVISHERVEVANVLARIWEAALTSPLGITVRDLCHDIKPLGKLAKQVGRTASALALELCLQLQASGRGYVQAGKRNSIKFFAVTRPPNDGSNPPHNGGGSPSSPQPSGTDGDEAATVSTVSQKLTAQAFDQSPEFVVSPATDQILNAIANPIPEVPPETSVEMVPDLPEVPKVKPVVESGLPNPEVALLEVPPIEAPPVTPFFTQPEQTDTNPQPARVPKITSVFELRCLIFAISRFFSPVEERERVWEEWRIAELAWLWLPSQEFQTRLAALEFEPSDLPPGTEPDFSTAPLIPGEPDYTGEAAKREALDARTKKLKAIAHNIRTKGVHEVFEALKLFKLPIVDWVCCNLLTADDRAKFRDLTLKWVEELQF